MSVDYRFLPQARGREVKADAEAALHFAVISLSETVGVTRKVIVGGSSAGLSTIPHLCFFLISFLVRGLFADVR